MGFIGGSGSFAEEAGLLAVTSLDQAMAKLDSTEGADLLASAPSHGGAPVVAFAGMIVGIVGMCAAASLLFSERRRCR